MADRFPLILNTSANQIQEIASGDTLDLTGSNIKGVGIITATNLSGNIIAGAGTSNIVSGILTAVAADIDDFVDVGSNIQLGNAGVITATTFKGDGDFVDLDVDGHTNLDNVSISGVVTATTFSGSGASLTGIANANIAAGAAISGTKISPNFSGQNIVNSGTLTTGNATATKLTISGSTVPLIDFIDSNDNPDFSIRADVGSFRIKDTTNNVERLIINSDGHIDIAGNVDFGAGIDVTGNATVSGNLSVGGVLTYEDVTNVDSIGIITARNGITVSSGTATFQGAIDANGDLDVDGHTNLDNVSVAGVSTYTGAATFNGSVNSNAALNIGANSHITLASGNWAGDAYGKIQHHASRLYLGAGSNPDPSFVIRYSGSDRIYMTSGGTFYPTTDSASDLGKSSVRWANVYADTLYGDGSNLTGLNTDLVNDTSPQLGGNLDCNNKVVTLNDSTGSGNNRLKIGNAGDLQLFHQSNANYVSGEVDGKDLYVRSRRDLHLVCGDNSGGYRNVIYADNNGSARLYHPASAAVRLQTSTAGVSVTGSLTTSDTITVQKSAQASLIIGSTNAGGAFLGLDGDSNGDASGGDYSYLRHNTSGDLEIVGNKPSGGANLRFYANAANLFLTLSSSGNLYPQTNNAQDLGTTAYRFRNIYVNDLQLSNEAKKDEGGNDVDGTWGDFTIQEGESDLYLINNRSGKKYKFNLTEVS